jgi:hypothetical protein
MGMHRHAVLSSLHQGTPLAAARSSSDPQRLAWIGVYPLDLSSSMTREFLRNRGVQVFPASGRAYHVRSFEVDRKLIEADASVSERELCNQTSALAFSDDELEKELYTLGIQVDALELPYKSDYPI